MKRFLLLATLLPFVSFSMMNEEGDGQNPEEVLVSTSTHSSVRRDPFQREESRPSTTVTPSAPFQEGESVEAFALRTGTITERMRGDDRSIIITELGKIVDKEQRADVVEHAKKLITEGMYGSERASIIKALGDIPDAAQRVAVVALAQKELIKKRMSGDHRANIIKVLGAIPDEAQRKVFVVQAQNLITEEMDGIERSFIIKALGDIPDAAQRADVIALAQKKELITEGMYGSERASIIKALGDIPDAAQRVAVVALAQKELFTKRMRGDQRASIIEALGRISDEDQRADVVEHAKKLITEGMTGVQRASIIKMLGKLPDVEQRKVFVVQAKMLIPENMTGLDRSTIIEAVCGIPDAAQRSDVVVQAKMLIPENMTVYDRASIIEALGRIPDAEQRAGFITAYQQLVNGMGWVDSRQLIQQLKQVLDRGINIEQRVTAVLTQLNRDVEQGLQENQRFSRMLQLIQNPQAPFNRDNLEVQGEEALTAQRQVFYDNYAALLENDSLRPVLEKHVPGLDATAEHPSFEEVHAALQQDLADIKEPGTRHTVSTSGDATETLSESAFKAECALHTLERLKSQIRPDFVPYRGGNLPTIRDLLIGAYQVFKTEEVSTGMRVSVKDRIKHYIAGHWREVQQKVPGAASYEDSGVYMKAHPEVVDVIQQIMDGKDVEHEAVSSLGQIAIQIHTLGHEKPVVPVMSEKTALDKGFMNQYIQDNLKTFTTAFARELKSGKTQDRVAQEIAESLANPAAHSFGSNRLKSQFVGGLNTAFDVWSAEQEVFERQVHDLEMKQYNKQQARFLEAQLSPVIEALFMGNRGHNRHFLDQGEASRLACTDGVYLNLLGALNELPARSGVEAPNLQAVTHIAC